MADTVLEAKNLKKVYNFNMKNVSWDWQSVKGIALDVIGAILGEENS